MPRAKRTPSMARSALRRYLARPHWWGGPEKPRPADEDVPEEEWTHPARRYFRQASFLQATVWIAARLAEALEHAHGRGLLHRDLKPSNVLIAADGTPMLLDFNLSADVRRSGGEASVAAEVGGTLPYMAPEHLDAFDPDGTTPPEHVDERSDLYSLGLILFEMVTGRHAFRSTPQNWPLHETIQAMIAERRKGAPSARRCNGVVPWSLDSVLKKCLDPLPQRRYQHASDLADDLRRFLDDQPLAFAPEPDLAERLGKWARRHPRACSATTIGTLACALLVVCAGAAGVAARRHEATQARVRWAEFQAHAREAEVLTNTRSGPVEHLPAGIAEARKALELFAIEPGLPWPKGGELRGLDEATRRELRRRVPELLVHVLRAQLRLVAQRHDRAAFEWVVAHGVAWLNWAEALTPEPSPALLELRSEFEEQLGLTAEAKRDRERVKDLPARTARDCLARGIVLLGQGRAADAEPLLARAAVEDPTNYWVWFNLGLCRSDLGRHLEAACHYATCTALQPDFSWGYLNQGSELARMGRFDEALTAYDRALAVNPDFRDALFNRGLLRLEKGQAAAAEADLQRARKLGMAGPDMLAGIAEALDRLGKHEESERLFNEALVRHPDAPHLLLGRGALMVRRDPARAKADFQAALALDPHLARAYLGLAQAARTEGEPTEAVLKHLDRALAEDPDLLDAVELRALVRARLGRREALDDVARLVDRPDPRRLYNAVCAVALLARDDPKLVPRGRDLLKRALRAGFPSSEAERDPDLDVLREAPEDVQAP
jgi:tetratricopeptide (TPR) repeat protein